MIYRVGQKSKPAYFASIAADWASRYPRRPLWAEQTCMQRNLITWFRSCLRRST